MIINKKQKRGVRSPSAPRNKTPLKQRLATPFVTVWSMISGKGITKRWLFNTFAIIAAVTGAALITKLLGG